MIPFNYLNNNCLFLMTIKITKKARLNCRALNFSIIVSTLHLSPVVRNAVIWTEIAIPIWAPVAFDRGDKIVILVVFNNDCIQNIHIRSNN